MAHRTARPFAAPHRGPSWVRAAQSTIASSSGRAVLSEPLRVLGLRQKHPCVEEHDERHGPFSYRSSVSGRLLPDVREKFRIGQASPDGYFRTSGKRPAGGAL